ncbi:MAG: hypothetical protein WCF30_12140 [Terracidiphilus sp.]
MPSAHAIHETWHPQTKQDREAVLAELEAILASPHFCNSKRYPALLRFIVENSLAAKVELLKERTLGVEVFDRPHAYDTNADTVVRYTAGEVRKRLLLYYSEQSHPSSIRISLPSGSYVPEFVHASLEPADAASVTESHGASQSDTGPWLHTETSGAGGSVPHAAAGEVLHGSSAPEPATGAMRLLLPALFVMLLLALAAGAWWRYRANPSQNQVDEFWAPVVHGQHNLLICTGSSVFSSNRYSGVETANRDIDYPFVSWQSVSAAVQISGVLSRTGVSTQLVSAPSAALTDLREHSVTLLGAYNNQWTMHLQQPLRYYFLPGADEIIVDRMQPQVQWKRDQSLPYSNSDDYAVVARFHDATIDGWVVMLAGVGRNGTEAAAEFVTSPHYLQLLRDRIGSNFANRNIEVVLKINVIDGKTGAPTILAVSTW